MVDQARAHRALRAGGELVLEVQTEAQVRSAEGATPTWHTAEGGLFAEDPHLVLHERFWDEAARAATERWHVIDAATGSVTRFALSNEAYTHDELEALLRAAGFAKVRDEHGGDSILYYGGGGQGNHLPAAYSRTTRALLGSKYRSSALAQDDICWESHNPNYSSKGYWPSIDIDFLPP